MLITELHYLLYVQCDHFQIIERGLMTPSDYDEASSKALSLFEYGQVPDHTYSSSIYMLTLITS